MGGLSHYRPYLRDASGSTFDRYPELDNNRLIRNEEAVNTSETIEDFLDQKVHHIYQ